MSWWRRIAVLPVFFAVSLSASARAEVAWDKGDPARPVLESVRRAAADLRGLSSSADLTGTHSDGCSSDSSAIEPQNCTSAADEDYRLIAVEDPPVIHPELTSARLAAAFPVPVPGLAPVAPIANAFILAPRWNFFAASAVLPFRPAAVVLPVP